MRVLLEKNALSAKKARKEVSLYFVL